MLRESGASRLMPVFWFRWSSFDMEIKWLHSMSECMKHNPSVSGSGIFRLKKSRGGGKKCKSSFTLAKHCQKRGSKETQSQSDDYSSAFCWALLNLICPPAQKRIFSNRRLREWISINASCVSKSLCCHFLAVNSACSPEKWHTVKDKTKCYRPNEHIWT